MKARKQIQTLKIFKFDRTNYSYFNDGIVLPGGDWAINVTQIFQEWFGREVKFAFLIDTAFDKEYAKQIAEKLVSDYNKSSNFWFDDGNLVIVFKNGKIFEISSSEWGFIKQIQGESKE